MFGIFFWKEQMWLSGRCDLWALVEVQRSVVITLKTIEGSETDTTQRAAATSPRWGPYMELDCVHLISWERGDHYLTHLWSGDGASKHVFPCNHGTVKSSWIRSAAALWKLNIWLHQEATNQTALPPDVTNEGNKSLRAHQSEIIHTYFKFTHNSFSIWVLAWFNSSFFLLTVRHPF